MTTGEKSQQRALKEMIEQQTATVVSTRQAVQLVPRMDRWLYSERDPGGDPKKPRVDIPEEAIQYFEKEVATASSENAWVAYIQADLRHWYALLLARSLSKGSPSVVSLDAHATRFIPRCIAALNTL